MLMKKYGTFRCWGFFFLYSALLMLFCTKSSPLFVFNNWTDANAAFTMGKSMMRGLAPYKDLFNHKGPFLYLLYGLAYLMHNTGFYGLYVLQSLSMAVLLFFCYRIARLYIQRDGVAMGVALLVPVFVLARGIYVTEFDYGGGSAEEFMLPLIAMSVYSVARYAQDDGCRYEKPLRAVCLIQGVVFVLMFMTKFTIAVFSLGLLFPFFVDMLCKRKWKALCQAVAYTLMGIGLASLPYLVYALCTNSLSAFGEVYIRINILYSGTEGAGILKKAFQTINQTVSFMLSNDTKKALPSLLTLLGFGFAVFMDKARPLAYRLSVLLGWALLFLSESIRPFTYSYIIMMFYPLFGLIALAKAALYFRGRFSVSEASRSSHKAEGAALRAAIVFLAAGLTIGGNLLMNSELVRVYKGKPLVTSQAQIADLVNRDHPENRTLQDLNSLDNGIYTALGILPSTPYYTRTNISYSAYPDILDGQLANVIAGTTKYVVLTSTSAEKLLPVSKNSNIGLRIQNAVLEGYDLVKIVQKTSVSSTTYYNHLYRLRDYLPQSIGETGMLDACNPLLSVDKGDFIEGKIASTRQKGRLFHGPYTQIAEGTYDITFFFDECMAPVDEAVRVDVLENKTPLASAAVPSNQKSVTLERVAFDNTADVSFAVNILEKEAEVVFSHIALKRVE